MNKRSGKKSEMVIVLSIFVLSLLLAACSGNKNSVDNPGGTPEVIKTTPVPTVSPTDTANAENPEVKAYVSVLKNEDDFYSINDNKKLLLKDYLAGYFLGEQLEITRFTVLDIDADNTPEVVLELSVNGNPECYEILHYGDDQVYGFNVVYRGLEQLKTDGTFWSSGGAADNECDQLRFNSGKYDSIILANSVSKQDNTGMTVDYFISGQRDTKEAFDAFAQKQDSKEDVSWYEYSQSGIEKELSASKQAS